MKFGFFGAGGTGKTTLAERLAETLKIPFYKSTTRDVFARFGVTQKDMPNLSATMKKDIQVANFDAKEAYDAERPQGVFDRTLLDHMMYLLIYCHDMLTDEEYDTHLHRTYRNLRTYDHLVYFPIYPWATIPEDGFREAGIANRSLQDHTINGLLQKIDHKFSDMPRPVIFTMPDLPVPQRLNWVRNMFGR